MGMKACVLALTRDAASLASDDRQLALAIKAQSDFDGVELAPRPRIPDAEGCIQSQAAALSSVSSPEERSLLYHTGKATASSPTPRPRTIRASF